MERHGSSLRPEIAEYYDRGAEHERLTRGPEGQLELLRTQALLARLLPPPPAAIVDVGGGAGIHAVPLTERGYEVQLLDPMPLHVEHARAAGVPSASERLTPARPDRPRPSRSGRRAAALRPDAWFRPPAIGRRGRRCPVAAACRGA